ncbi:MAG: FeoB-associated Cys-rich membrane protein [Flavobacterium stagni]
MAFQELVVYLAFGIALAYLYERFKKRKKKKNDSNCGDGNCGC